MSILKRALKRFSLEFGKHRPPTHAIGMGLNCLSPPAKHEPKDLETVIAESDENVRRANESLRHVYAELMRKHGMSEVDIQNWFSACDQQAEALHVIRAREMTIRGYPQEVIDSLLRSPVIFDTSLSQCQISAH